MESSRRDFLLHLMPTRSICAEIGVWEGEFSSCIINIVKPRELHLIDPWKFEEDLIYRKSLYGNPGESQCRMENRYRMIQENFRNQILSKEVVIRRQASREAVEEFPDNYFDWIYIDGNHLYEHVKKDLELYYPKVKGGGFIAGDDYQLPGWWNDGVTQAVDEFSSKPLVAKILTHSNQFILKKLR